MHPMKASYYYYAADLAYKANDYENTLKILNQSPNSDTNSYTQMTIASIYFSQKKYKEALLSVDKLQTMPLTKENFLLAQKLKYKIQRGLGFADEAEKTLASIKKLDPGFNADNEGKNILVLLPEKVKAYIQNAERLRRNGQFTEALDVLAEANSIQETAFANLIIGKILLKQNNPNTLIYFEKAYKEIKDDPSLIYNLSLLYMMKGDLSKAKATMDDFARLKGNKDPQFKQLLALFENRSGKKRNTNE
jgi:tetratricopeptide (TPR) repeat protein